MMSKIQFEQINEDTVEITIPSETPMEMVQQLTKSLTARGLVEDVENSTLSVRYFYKPQDELNKKADELIKSLQQLVKNDDEPYWSVKSKFAQQKKNRAIDIAERRKKAGVNTSGAPKPNITPPSTGPVTTSGKPNTLVGEIGEKTYSNVAQNYAKKLKQSEHDEDEDDVEKSGYGPKGGGQYSVVDNIRRKARNLSEQAGQGPNVNVKAYSSKPGQLSGKQSASDLSRKQAAMSRKQPVKIYSEEEKEALARQMGLKKGWANHNSIPSAEEEIMKFAKETAANNQEYEVANQLAKMMNSKAMLNPNHRQPSSEDMLMAGEAMGLGASEKMIKQEEQQWNNGINNWLAEASKPISQRFASEEEEMAYWSSIKVADSDRGEPGY